MRDEDPLSKTAVSDAQARAQLRMHLYVVCWLTDFAAFLLIFAVSRSFAERNTESWYLGLVGGGLSFSAGVGSFLGGWLSHRFDSRAVFVRGVLFLGLSIGLCALGNPQSAWFLPGYWILGLGLGFLYPPLMGWLNQGEDPHANRRGVSRTLIVFCIAWNLGMMTGQLTGGALFALGPKWIYGTALAVSLLNLVVAAATIRRVTRLHVQPRRATARELSDVALAGAFKRLSWIANLGGMFGGSMVIHLLPDLAVKIGVPPDNHGMLLAFWRCVIIATYLLMHGLDFWRYRLGSSLVSQLAAAAGLLVIAMAESSGALFVGLALLGQLVGYNYFSGLFYSTAGSAQQRRALAAGIHEATLATGMAIGTLVGGLLGSWVNERLPYLSAAGVMLLLIAVQSAAWWRWARPLHRQAALEPAPLPMAAAVFTSGEPSGHQPITATSEPRGE